MSVSSCRVGWLAAAAIVALRVGIGVHFLGEGLSKLADPKPFSAGFFGNAKGPFAPLYRGMVWDADGEFRLDLDGTLADWDAFRQRIVNHYGFDDSQAKKAEQAVKAYEGRIRQFFGAKSETIEEYFRWLERRRENETKSERQLASLQAHDSRIAGETRKLWGELIPTIDRLWKDLENDLNALATDEQWERHGRLTINKAGRGPVALDSEAMDQFIPWFNVVIGACLILGLFTRVAAVLGAAFLASVCLSQWPASPGAAPIYYQAVEMLALLVLAAIGAGQFLGIDYLFAGCRAWCCPAKTTGAAL